MTNVLFDNATSGGGNTNTFSFPFTVGNNPNTIILMGIYVTSAATTLPSAPTINGVSMGLISSNAGPTVSFGGLFIYALQNPPTGSQTIAYSTGLDVTSKYHVVYSYYNVKKIDVSAITQGSYTGGNPLSESLTGTVDNTLMWACVAAHDGTGNTPSGSTGPNNVNLTTFGNGVIRGGDYGVISSPTSETASVGANPGVGVGCVFLASLEGPQMYSISLVTGVYSLMGRSIILTLNKLYTLAVTKGSYALNGFAVTFTHVLYKWKFVAKASGNTWTDVPKATVPFEETVSSGTPIGLLLALTYSQSFILGGWKNVTKAIVPTSWTDVPKAN